MAAAAGSGMAPPAVEDMIGIMRTSCHLIAAATALVVFTAAWAV